MSLESFPDAGLDRPALEPPPGATSNLSGPPNERTLFGIVILCLIITVTMSLMRLYVKYWISGKWHIEDYALIASLLFSTGHYAPALHVYTFAPGVHQWDLSVRSLQRLLFDFHIGVILYNLTILSLKVSILVQFLRVFLPTGDRSLTFWATHTLLWVNVVSYILIVCLELASAKPMAKVWNPDGGEDNWPKSRIIFTSISGSLNCLLDLLILAWTQNVIWGLHMPVKTKVKLGVLFLGGLSACIFGSLGVYQNIKLLWTKDYAFEASIMALYTFPETTSGFLILCLPILPKFLDRMVAKLFPNYSAVASQIKTRMRLRRSSMPLNHENPSDSGETKQRRQSLWHISTDNESSEMHVCRVGDQEMTRPLAVHTTSPSGVSPPKYMRSDGIW